MIYHTCLVLLGTGLIGTAWNTNRNDIVLLTFIMMIISHYVIGLFLIDYRTWYKNALSIAGVIILNSLLMLINSQIHNEYQSALEYLVIMYKLPFLYLLGWNGLNIPVLTSIIPAILLWLGLETKVILKKLKT